jgi:hypothetical protein
LGIGILAAILGFAGGYQSAQPAKLTSTSPPASPASPPITPASAISVNALSAPKNALKSFLAARDWKSRRALVLFQERVAKQMESYYSNHPDAPTVATRLAVEHCESDPSSELLLTVFRVTTADCPTGFTVAVEETPDGWKIDWESFIEFKDMLFDRFAAGKNGETGRFHLVTQPAATPTTRENAISYVLLDPVKGTEHTAYATKGSEAAATLARLTADGAIGTPILELERHPETDGTATIKICSVIASSWRPQRGN